MAYTRLNKEIHQINVKNIQTNKNVWKNKNEDAKGPSFLNQKTVLTL